jgi:hypothetical protein
MKEKSRKKEKEGGVATLLFELTKIPKYATLYSIRLSTCLLLHTGGEDGKIPCITRIHCFLSIKDAMKFS